MISLLEKQNDCAHGDSSVSAAMAALYQNHTAIAEFVGDVFEDLESLGLEAEVRARLLDELRSNSAGQAAELKSLRQAEAESRGQLEAARHEIESARQRMAELPTEAIRLRETLHELELERCSLETELEALRIRTAELTDHLSELKQQTADERAEWSGELKQLRRTIDRQTELFADRFAASGKMERIVAPSATPQNASQDTAASSAASAIPATIPTPPKDAVIGSVIAQFELLQRDRQRRRSPS